LDRIVITPFIPLTLRGRIRERLTLRGTYLKGDRVHDPEGSHYKR